MPRKCAVLECTSNYATSGEYVSIFSFPNDKSRAELWAKSINRKNFIPTKYSCICIKHFDKKFVVLEDKRIRADGTILTVKRSRPALTKDSYPTIFPSQPSKSNNIKNALKRHKNKKAAVDVDRIMGKPANNPTHVNWISALDIFDEVQPKTRVEKVFPRNQKLFEISSREFTNCVSQRLECTSNTLFQDESIYIKEEPQSLDKEDYGNIFEPTVVIKQETPDSDDEYNQQLQQNESIDVKEEPQSLVEEDYVNIFEPTVMIKQETLDSDDEYNQQVLTSESIKNEPESEFSSRSEQDLNNIDSKNCTENFSISVVADPDDETKPEVESLSINSEKVIQSEFFYTIRNELRNMDFTNCSISLCENTTAEFLEQKESEKLIFDEQLVNGNLDEKCIQRAVICFACCYCKFISYSLLSLRVHIVSHRKLVKGGYYCFSDKVCIYSTRNLLALRDHLDTHKEKKFKSLQCTLKCAYFSNVTTHLAFHSGQNVIMCQYCKHCFLSESYFRHLRTLHSDCKDAKKIKTFYKCVKCKFKVRNKLIIIEHLKDCCGLQGNNKCSNCKYITYQKKFLNFHSGIHRLKKPYKCETCPYETMHRKYFRIHLKLHELTDSNLLRCGECFQFSVSFVQKENMITHIKEHGTFKHLKCSDCSFRCNGRLILKRHVILNHTEKTLKCNQCSFSTKYSSSLKYHLGIHSNKGETIKCELCNYSCFFKRYLRKHIRRVHKKVRPNKCKRCDYASSDANNLYMHLKTHNAKRLYMCNDCNFTVSSKKEYIIHVRTHRRKNLLNHIL